MNIIPLRISAKLPLALATTLVLVAGAAVQAGTVPPSEKVRVERGQQPQQREQAPPRQQGQQGQQSQPREGRGRPDGQAAPSQPRNNYRAGDGGQRNESRGNDGRRDDRGGSWNNSGNGNNSNNNRADNRQGRNWNTTGGVYHHRPVPPRRYVPTLPSGHQRHNWNGRPYYYYGGSWYRPWGSQFAVVSAPYGLFVNYLPSYHSSVWYGGSRYFYADNTYYLYQPERHGYVVSRSPYGGEEDSAGEEFNDDELYVYPARGQSEQQQADDRYECHRWAAEQTQYDPVDSDYDAGKREEYLRAMTACLTGRGYSVR